jgi:hypothetical protein
MCTREVFDRLVIDRLCPRGGGFEKANLLRRRLRLNSSVKLLLIRDRRGDFVIHAAKAAEEHASLGRAHSTRPPQQVLSGTPKGAATQVNLACCSMMCPVLD